MPRFALTLAAAFPLTLAAAFPLALAAALLPALAAADAPPPDRFTPCVDLREGDPCFKAGCTCVTVTVECPGGAASCLSCESANAWCGPTNYHPREDGGCSYAAPAGASALGALGIALLLRRRCR